MVFLTVSQEAQGVLAALGTAFCWALTAIAFGAAARRVGQFNVNLVRLALACVFLVVSCLAAGVFVEISSAQVLVLAGSGLVGLALGDAALFKSLEILGPRRTSLLMSLAPGFTAVLMVPLLGETLSWPGVLGMVLTVGGVAVVVLERGAPGEIRGRVWAGVIFGVLGALGQALGLILSKVGLGAAGDSALAESTGVAASSVEVHPLYGTLVRIVVATAALALFAVAAGRMGAVVRSVKDRRALAQTTAGTIVGPFLGVTLSLAAVALANTAVAATIMATSPVLVIPMVRIIYKERTTRKAIVGALVAVAGVAVLAFRRSLGG